MNNQRQNVFSNRLGVSYSTKFINLNLKSNDSKFVYGKVYTKYKTITSSADNTQYRPKTLKKQEHRRKSLFISRIVMDSKCSPSNVRPNDHLRYNSAKRCFLHPKNTNFWKPVWHIRNDNTSHARLILNANVPYGNQHSEIIRREHLPKFYDFTKDRQLINEFYKIHLRGKKKQKLQKILNIPDDKMTTETIDPSTASTSSTRPAPIKIRKDYIDDKGKCYVFDVREFSVGSWGGLIEWSRCL